MSSANRKKEAHMATSQAKPKSAMDMLLESMDELVDSAAERMTPDELRKARKEINEVVDRAVVAHKRRRETA
jgi:RNA-splicing ligase RtcB